MKENNVKSRITLSQKKVNSHFRGEADTVSKPKYSLLHLHAVVRVLLERVNFRFRLGGDLGVPCRLVIPAGARTKNDLSRKKDKE
jgi:hypothetical protein